MLLKPPLELLQGVCEGNMLPLIRGEVRQKELRREGREREEERGEKGRKGGRYGGR